MSDPVPEPSPRSPLSPVRIRLSGAPLDQYGAALEYVRDRGYYHELDGDDLVVQARHEAEVRHAMSDTRTWAAVDIPGYLPVRAVRSRRARSAQVSFEDGSSRPLAARSLRFLGAVVDGTAAGLVSVGFRRLVDDERTALLLARAVVEVATILPVALWGWSVGKLVVGTRIRRLDGRRPGLPTAVLRWVVPAVPTSVALVLAATSTGAAVALDLAGFVAVYVGILVGADRRGLHDLAAGTVVIRRG